MKKLGLLVMPLMAMSLLASCNKGGGDDSLKPLTFTCNSDTGSLSINCETEGEIPFTPNLICTKNGKDKIEISLSENKDYPIYSDLKKGDQVQIYGNNPDGFTYPRFQESYRYNRFFTGVSDNFSVSGNIASIYKEQDFDKCESIPKYFYFELFSAYSIPTNREIRECKITDANELTFPNVVSEFIYDNLFYKCTSLEKAPKILPAASLETACYMAMFQGCTSLIQAPELPATTLADNCYKKMFYDCEKLNYLKVGFGTPNESTWPEEKDCTTSWLYNVAATGTFVWKGSTDVASRSEDTIPENWTITNAD